MVNWRVWLSVRTRLELKRVPTGATKLDTPALSEKYFTVLFGWLLLLFIPNIELYHKLLFICTLLENSYEGGYDLKICVDNKNLCFKHLKQIPKAK